ncbi:SURF1 family protein [Aliiruegeria sabulilitoris]|uniref:SURF1 family protein n=1 Tax=Aliiruegeria sabulilitoris TaxID=1510458 RepID=UPI0008355BA2|nr:SURF1 family protein [Aliiruegeria sabulilitoris]NDR55989.1 SURF1 family protein [Pseudoruegeria sp. M32A2M]
MKRYIAPLLIGLIGGGILISLGVWQVQRLAWKEAILSEIDRQILAAPVPVPVNPDADTDQYLPVEVSGATGQRELHFLVSTRKLGPGFRIITALEMDNGRRILLDHGFIPTDAKQAKRTPGTVTVIGNLHWPEERDRFTPENDPETNYWYARDVPLLAGVLETEPVLVVARKMTPADPTVTPLPVDSSGIPNDHLGYAVTWFGLALCWLGMTALQLWRISRRNP